MSNTLADESVRFLYLVQHGEAKAKEEDPERPLTERGRKAVEHVAVWSARMGLNVDQIRHSGKRRAEQTAEIFAQHLKVPEGVVAVSGLAPNDDVVPVARALEQETRTLMLVGHLPFLSRLASQLLVNDSKKTIIRFKMGGLVGLAREAGLWSVACLVPPDIIAD
jgi:phosphohistidine phosphatase